MKLTVALYYTPNGSSIQAEGIVPDVEVLYEAPKAEDAEKPRLLLREKDLNRHLENAKDRKDKKAKDNEAVKANPALTALNEQMPYMIPQGQHPSNYWILTQNLGDSITAGKYNDADDAHLMEVLEKTQKTSKSLNG